MKKLILSLALSAVSLVWIGCQAEAQTKIGSTKVVETLEDSLDDEGKFASITFSDDTVQTTAGGGGGAFTDTDPIVPNTTTNDMALGTSHTNTAKLSIDGDADQVQLSVQFNATQTNKGVIVEKSDGTDLLTIDNAGDMVVTGDVSANSFTSTQADGEHFINASNTAGYTGSSATAGALNYDAGAARWEMYDGSDWNAYLIHNEHIDTFAELDVIVADKTLASSDSTNTFTNKTVDANGTGNTYTNFDEGNMLAGSDLVRTALEFVIDGAGSAITTGIKGDIEVPFGCTIQRVTMLADQSGSIVVDIWKDTYANYPATDADSITASAVPTITTATKSQDTTLTGWTTALAAGDIIRFNVDSATTVTKVTISLVVEK